MISDFKDETTRDIYDGFNTRKARKIPKVLWSVARRKMDMLNAARSLSDLQKPPGNRLEELSERYTGFHSIRVNDQYRVIFQWKDGSAHKVEITDYH